MPRAFGPDDVGDQQAAMTRTQDEACQACGSSEGSVVKHRDDGWVLCDTCMNDPDTLEKYADG